MHCSHMIENCTAYGPLWVNGLKIMANKMGPYRWLHKLASRSLWAHVNLLAGVALLYQRPMQAFHFGRQSATYKFCGPAHCSRMTENQTTYGPMWVNGLEIMANQIGHTGDCASWLPGFCGPTWIYRQKRHICIKDQCEHFALAANLLPMNSVGPHVVLV
jgi:hypothetical protein